MPFLTKGKTNWKYILIVLILAVIVGGLALCCLWKMKWEIPITKFPLKKEISEQKALELANQILQSKCKMSFTEIKKVDWTKEGPGFDIYESICPEAKNYKENKIWVAEKKLNENYQAIAHVGIDGKFVCVFASTIGAAPGGPFPLDQACPKDETANWKTYRNEKYGFEIKYPEDWQAGGLFGHEESGMFFEKYFEKSTTVHSKCMLSISYIPYEIFKKYFKSHNSYVGGVPATKVVDVGTYYYFKYQDHYFEIFHLILVSEYSEGHWIDVRNTISPEIDFLCEKVFNQMLSTFRFLE